MLCKYKISKQEILQQPDLGKALKYSIPWMDAYMEAEKMRKYKNRVKSIYGNRNDYFDGAKLQELLFPQIDSSSVFISHSSDDQKIAIKLKGIIERELGFEAFVDSLYWDSVYSIQGKLQEEYDPNSVSKHLYTMLNSAITLMIAQCKYFIFVESDNSLNEENLTESPWIYHELQIAEILQRIGVGLESHCKMENDKPKMQCSYNVKSIVGNMKPTTIKEILLWQ